MYSQDFSGNIWDFKLVVNPLTRRLIVTGLSSYILLYVYVQKLFKYGYNCLIIVNLKSCCCSNMNIKVMSHPVASCVQSLNLVLSVNHVLHFVFM